ncbi:hypothetical protein IMCC3317_12450 [Kordia antarctica]|uniref:Uncharacterized protein n=1 Tax=Kordia antarctica TaxID=1218801 RepID=A0A7L4ZHE9_9FLAO|nr:hypothetical protein [Kordia antarctica]QHI35897.1 hypothetical protein IMCC3317_12450 [Kordia antarctica]
MKNKLFKKNVIEKSEANEILGGYIYDTIGERATATYRLFYGVVHDREPYTDRESSSAPTQSQEPSSAETAQ